MELSIIIPAKNEARGLEKLLSQVIGLYPSAEVLVINDGSEDDTPGVCRAHSVTCVSHPYPMGNGAAVKTGARAAKGKVLVFIDGDGQHDPENIAGLLAMMDDGFDMAVGARDANSHASFGRLCANLFYNRFASLMVGRRVEDLTSGMRAVKADKFREFLHLLPNGFSYPTTITMAFFRSGYALGYLPIVARKRVGSSHIKPFRDGVRFLLILFKIGTLYSPLKIFFPISVLGFTTGLCYYLYTFLSAGRFTNMSALLFTTSVIIFLMGLISEQITGLLYQASKRSTK